MTAPTAIMGASENAPARVQPPGAWPTGGDPMDGTQRTCECGCGEVPPVATFTNARRGIVKGEPMRWCPGHYHRRNREVEIRKRIGEPDANGCWPWRGRKNPKGYGQLAIHGAIEPAHRAVYELLVGPIPPERELDHLCRNRSCVNPAHLEPVSHRENTLRSPTSPTAVNARKTHCIHGHEFTPANTYVQTGGGRGCRACRDGWNRSRGK